MIETNVVAESQDDEHPAFFHHIRATFKLHSVPKLASRLCQKYFQDQACSCKAISETLFRSHHILFRIAFTDKACWLLNVPTDSYQGGF
ncbi:hypothetical protein BDW68DRAFT_163488 [Aspergillus falconensis]